MQLRTIFFQYTSVLLALWSVLLTPVCAFGYTSVAALPVDQHAVLTLTHPEESQEQFGKLTDFPHTFEFEVTKAMPFKAVVSVVNDQGQKNDAALIIVKAEEHGVSEIGRTVAKEDVWKPSYNYMYAETFREGGSLEGTLQPGRYTLEVSAPNNDAAYRLVWGTVPIHRNYFANVWALFEEKQAVRHSLFGVFLSPLIYVPLLVLIIGGYAFYWRRKRNQADFV